MNLFNSPFLLISRSQSIIAAAFLIVVAATTFAQPLVPVDPEVSNESPHFLGAAALPPLPNDYSENFDTYAGSAATVPFGWSVSFTGTANFGGTNAGTSSAGGAYAYGAGSDFSFGALHTGTTGLITLAVNLINDTGSTLTSLTIQWNYEQWRFANTSGFDLSGTGALAGDATLNAADFTGATSGSAGAQTPVSLTLTGLSIAPGASYGLSWVTTDATGADNGIAIDDFAISAGSPIPELSTIQMLFLGGALLTGLSRLRRKLS